MGAHAYIDAESSDAAEELQKLGGARVILCTAPNAKAISGLIGGPAAGGRLIVVAAPSEPLQLPVGRLFGGGLSIKGWHSQPPRCTSGRC